ncbi:Gfo/Idh/MocA family protein [Paludibaculum fermentans]|uniref:Gfo/Idh/MocA family oxidoreductase n=1 Tax=Paludibaculum fermentans TaxID=1473598 RepID=A0A7S7NKS7_PALFE|nr:Gfo/Idh/MocA family oxidoreductase [Paludibaculum fermentans]QOY85437.1 Gfo/Idh/MocA family oxidoreductase [Paludibaculum fermentans]
MAHTRRHFFYGALLAGAVPTAGFGSVASMKFAGYKSPNEKLNFAAIGSGGQGASNLGAAAPTENIVALCDVDDRRAAPSFNRYPTATKYKDFRQMLDKEAKNIDSVIVATPDHMHATAAIWCMERGKNVYVQKPLVRTIWEARQLRAAAAKYGVATQMGNQGYSNEGTRQCAEIVWNGDIGAVSEVHAWSDRPLWPQGLTEIPKEEPVPATLDWDLWLGPAEKRPFTAGGATEPDRWGGFFYQPFNWRGFYDFGCGALGDMACHILGAPNMALHLSKRKIVGVECIKKEGTSPFMFPKVSVIRYDFAAYGDMPALKIFWYDGLKQNPTVPGVPEGEWIGDPPSIVRNQPAGAPGAGGPGGPGARRPGGGPGMMRPAGNDFHSPGRVFNYDDFKAMKDPEAKLRFPTPDGSVFLGDKGVLTTGTYGEVTRLLPVEKMKDYQMPAPLLTRSPGHMRDFIRACKGGDPACSNFDVAAPFVEWMLLGVIALRHEGKLEYDPDKMRITNNVEANKLLKPVFRKGWEFHTVKS